MSVACLPNNNRQKTAETNHIGFNQLYEHDSICLLPYHTAVEPDI